jgi:hypothetical protein
VDELKAVTELLYAPGISMLGHEMSEAEAIARVRKRFPKAKYCVVRNWIWIDLDLPDLVREELISTQRQPVMLYAHQVVCDSQGRFDRGDWVRSSPLLRFTHGMFFETSNSVYVLVGHGVRKRASLSTVVKVF